MTNTEMLIGSREVPYEEIDVVVAGASAGVVAAIKAADFGVKVICLDKLGSMDPEKITPVAPAEVPAGWGNCTAKSGGTVVVDEEPTYISSYAIFPGLGYSFVMACLAAESALEEIRPVTKNLAQWSSEGNALGRELPKSPTGKILKRAVGEDYRTG